MGYYIERSSFPFKDSDKDRPSCVVGHTMRRKKIGIRKRVLVRHKLNVILNCLPFCIIDFLHQLKIGVAR